ncbi:MAG: RNA polymerase sigma factor [Caulobacter sp.]|nr:RNA polymerase sigma factor [Caulobacter sp.]
MAKSPHLEASDALAIRARSLRGPLSRYFARSVRDLSEVEDLVQEVFLRIVRRGDYEQLEHLDGYIFETAASVLKDHFRQGQARRRDRHVEFESDRHGASTPGAEATLTSRESLEAAIQTLMVLPQRTRTVFVMRRLEGLSYREIAARMGISVSGVEKHMVRAVQHLLARRETAR